MKRRGGAWIMAAVVFLGFYGVALHGMRDDPSGGGANVGAFPAQLRPVLAGAVACAAIGVSVFVVDLVYRRRKKGHE